MTSNNEDQPGRAFDAREFILATPTPPSRPPTGSHEVRDWMLESDCPHPVPLDSVLETVLADDLATLGFSAAQVRCQLQPPCVELHMNSLTRLRVGEAMDKLRLVAQRCGYQIPPGRLVATVQDHRVEAVFSVEPA